MRVAGHKRLFTWFLWCLTHSSFIEHIFSHCVRVSRIINQIKVSFTFQTTLTYCKNNKTWCKQVQSALQTWCGSIDICAVLEMTHAVIFHHFVDLFSSPVDFVYHTWIAFSWAISAPNRLIQSFSLENVRPHRSHRISLVEFAIADRYAPFDSGLFESLLPTLSTHLSAHSTRNKQQNYTASRIKCWTNLSYVLGKSPTFDFVGDLHVTWKIYQVALGYKFKQFRAEQVNRILIGFDDLQWCGFGLHELRICVRSRIAR